MWLYRFSILFFVFIVCSTSARRSQGTGFASLCVHNSGVLLCRWVIRAARSRPLPKQLWLVMILFTRHTPTLNKIFDKCGIALYQNESLDLDHYYQEPYQDEGDEIKVIGEPFETDKSKKIRKYDVVIEDE